MKKIIILAILLLVLFSACNKDKSGFVKSTWTMNGKQYKSNLYYTSYSTNIGSELYVGSDLKGNYILPWVYFSFNLDTFPKSGEFRNFAYRVNCYSPECVDLFLSDEVLNYIISPYEINKKIKADEVDGMPRYTLSPTWFWVYKIKTDNMGIRYSDPTGDSVLIAGEFYMPFK